MLTPETMRQVNIVVLKDDLDAVTERIAEMGVLHLADSSEIEEWTRDLSSVNSVEIFERAANLEKKAREIARGIGMANLPATISSAAQYMSARDLEAAESAISAIEAEVAGLIVSRDSKSQEIEKNLAIRSELAKFEPLGRIDLGASYSFLDIRTGRASRQNTAILEKTLQSIPHLLLPLAVEGETVTLAVVALKKDRAALDSALREAAFESAAPPAQHGEIPGDLRERMGGRIAKLRDELGVIDEAMAAARRKHRQSLTDLIEKINCTKLLSRARNTFRSTGSAVLISGWVPEPEVPCLSEAITRTTGGRCYMDVRNPEDVAGVKDGSVKVPVLLKNPRLARPFEFLTSMYGVPPYGAIDPTVFVAATFLVMFGVMFGDVGEGFILSAVGSLLRRKRYDATLRRVGSMILSAGISSIIFGLLYGTIFGVEGILRPLWIRPMGDVMFLVKTAIYFGIAVVSLGVVLNIVNAARTGDWVKGIFDKAGLLAGVIYWGAIGVVASTLLKGGRPATSGLTILVVGVPVVLLFARAPVARLLGRSGKLFPEGVLTYFIDVIIEIVEIATTFLSNTLSFVRVAAFALAHAMLFMAVFSLASIVRGAPGGSLYSAAVIVIGNALILVLEGIIVTVQAIRLEYYEFFGKFFSPEGKQYDPVKIH